MCFSFFKDGGDLLLASCAQDTLIRIWRVSLDNKIQESKLDMVHDVLQELKLTSNIFNVVDKGTTKKE